MKPNKFREDKVYLDRFITKAKNHLHEIRIKYNKIEAQIKLYQEQEDAKQMSLCLESRKQILSNIKYV